MCCFPGDKKCGSLCGCAGEKSRAGLGWNGDQGNRGESAQIYSHPQRNLSTNLTNRVQQQFPPCGQSLIRMNIAWTSHPRNTTANTALLTSIHGRGRCDTLQRVFVPRGPIPADRIRLGDGKARRTSALMAGAHEGVCGPEPASLVNDWLRGESPLFCALKGKPVFHYEGGFFPSQEGSCSRWTCSIESPV